VWTRERSVPLSATVLFTCTLAVDSFEPGQTSGAAGVPAGATSQSAVASATASTAGPGFPGPTLDAATHSAETPLAPPLVEPVVPSAGGTGGAPSSEQPCVLGSFGEAVEIGGLGVTGPLWAPTLSADGLELLFAAGTPEDLYRALRPARDAPFAPAAPVASLNTAANEGTPFLTQDGLGLYFYAASPQTPFDRDLWLSTREGPSQDFSGARPLSGLNTSAVEQMPWLSVDGLRLYFTSNRSGSRGLDLWLAVRAGRTAEFTVATNLAALNSPTADEHPSLSADELSLVVASDRTGSLGGRDLWLAERATVSEPFSELAPLTALNSGGSDVDGSLSADGRLIVFSSDRGTGRGLWLAQRACR
jgi:hypothetical protein